MDLEEAKAKFTDKLSDGTPIEITYVSSKDNLILGVMNPNTGPEILGWFNEDGVSVEQYGSLVEVKPILPKDVLCEVWKDRRTIHRCYSDGKGKFYLDGKTSRSSNGHRREWPNYKVIEDEPKPWFNNGECPIPEGCRYRVFVSGWYKPPSSPSKWTWNNSPLPITAYQILGEKDEGED